MSKLNESTVAEFKGQLVDILEDYLSEHGVTAENLPNEDRDDYEADDAAIIFGEDYDVIADGVQYELDTNGLMSGNASSQRVISKKVVDSIYATYEEIAEKLVGTDFSLGEEDANYIKKKIREIFSKWEV